NEDSLARRGVHIDVVHADARPTDHLQARCALDQLAGELRRRADDDRVVAPDDLRQGGVEIGVDFEARAQQVDACVRDRFPDEDLHTGAPSANASRARVTAWPRSMSAPSSASASSTAASAVATSNTS